MDLSSDRLGLNDLELFQTLREQFPESQSKTKNIIECKDDILFVWNSKDSCLLTLNLRAVNTGKPTFQRLIPSDPPVSDIEALTVSETCEDVALWGPGGLNVLHLPRKWGANGTFQAGKPTVMCRWRRADEHRKAMSPQLEIRRVRWHPGSPTASHLLELSSDNCLRLYDTAPDEIQLLQMWPVGRSPVGPMSSSRLPLLSSLGDTAVDFDFAPPVLVTEQNTFLDDDNDDNEDETQKFTPSVQWPIMVLRGNGTVLRVTAPLTKKSGMTKAVVRGPLPMYPPADDNYGVDACSIIVLPCSPPLLVVSTCTGTLYHCLIMDPDEREDSDTRLKKRWVGETQAVETLFVLESVELSLGLPVVNDDSYSSTCPLFLHHHPTARDRYLVSHNAGVHIVCLPVVAHLERFAHSADDKCDLSMPTFGSTAVTSLAEYLVCTRMGSNANKQSDSQNSLSAVLGVAVCEAPATLIVLLAGGEVVSLSLSSHHFPPQLPLSGPALLSSPSKDQKESFEERIRRLMKQGSTQPVLKLADGHGISPSEAMDLVAKTTQFLRDEYLQRHEKVCEEIDRRIRVLSVTKVHLLEEVEALKNQRAEISSESERLVDKFEELTKRKGQLAERAERVLHLACMKQAVPSIAELELAKRLISDKEKVAELQKKLKELRERQAYQRLKMNEYLSEEKKRYTGFEFSPKQQDAIRTSIAQMTLEISQLVKKVHISRAELGLTKSIKPVDS